MKHFILSRIPSVLLFLSIWLVVWHQPELRQVLRNQLEVRQFDPYDNLVGYDNLRHSSTDLYRQYPDDVNVAAQHAEEQGSTYYSLPASKTTGYTSCLQAYDEVIRRFPNRAWLIAARLRWTISAFHGDRLGGDFSNSKPPPYLTPSPEKSDTPPNFTPAQLQASIDLAYQGRKLEPDNCFFDWALVKLLMNGYRDAEAIQVLHEGAAKPRYDDHNYDTVAAKIAADERLGPLPIEGKHAVMSGDLFPEFASMRELSRLMAWQAWKAERSGDYNKSIQIGNDMAHLSAPMMRGRNELIAGLVAEAIQSIAWTAARTRHITRNQVPGPAANQQIAWAILASQRFAAYASAHGHPDIARQTLALGTQRAAFIGASRGMIASTGRILPSFIDVQTLWWLSAGCLVQTIALLVFAAMGSCILIATKPPPPRWGDLAISIGICIFVLAAAAFGSIHLRLGAMEYDMYFGSPSTMLRTTIAILCLLAFTISPFIVAALVCWIVTQWRLWRDRAQLAAQTATEFHPATEHLLPPDMRPILFSIMSLLYALATLGCAATSAVAFVTGSTSASTTTGTQTWNIPSPLGGTIPVDNPAAVFACLAAGLATLSFLGWVVQWRWMAPKPKRPYTHYALRWYRQSLSIFIVISSLTYAILAYSSLPYRRAADREFTLYMQRGELGSLGFPEVK